jgi:hypothetical protein
VIIQARSSLVVVCPTIDGIVATAAVAFPQSPCRRHPITNPRGGPVRRRQVLEISDGNAPHVLGRCRCAVGGHAALRLRADGSASVPLRSFVAGPRHDAMQFRTPSIGSSSTIKSQHFRSATGPTTAALQDVPYDCQANILIWAPTRLPNSYNWATVFSYFRLPLCRSLVGRRQGVLAPAVERGG